jgi:hypothetical protein
MKRLVQLSLLLLIIGASVLAIGWETQWEIEKAYNGVTIFAPKNTSGDTILFQNATSGTVYMTNGTDVTLADGGLGVSLSDPNADHVVFWDDSAGAAGWLQIGPTFSVTTTILNTVQDIRTSATPTFVGANLTGNSNQIVLDSDGAFTVTLNATVPATASRIITFQNMTSGTVYMSNGTDVPLLDGGTNASLTAVDGGVVASTDTGMEITAVGTTGQLLQSNAALTPTWTSDLLTTTTIGGGYIYRGTTDVPQFARIGLGVAADATKQIKLVNGATFDNISSPVLNIYTPETVQFSVGTMGGVQLKAMTAFANVTGETGTISVQVPANKKLFAGAVRANTTLTMVTGVSWSAYPSGKGSLIGTGLALTKNAKVTRIFDNLSTMTTAAAQDVFVVPNAGTFCSGDQIQATLWYWDAVDMPDLP